MTAIQRDPTTPTAEDGTAPLAAALAAFQAEMPTVPRTHRADVRSDKGSYSYNYADLADVVSAAMPLLTAQGLSFSSVPRYTDHGLELVGVLLHSSGESMEGALPIGGNTPQALGSSITYARRYLFGCMTGVVTDDDDDGRAASTAPKATRKKAATEDRPPGAVTPKQIRMIGALMRELQITDRTQALDYVIRVVGRPIDSRNDLTVEEAGRVIDALQTQGAPAPAASSVETPVDPWAPVDVPPTSPARGSAGPPGPADLDGDYRPSSGTEAKRPVVDLEDVPLPDELQPTGTGRPLPLGSDTNPPVAPEAPVRPPLAVPPSTARRIDRLLARELGDVATDAERAHLMSAVLDRAVTSTEDLTRPEALKLGEAFGHFADGSWSWEFDPTDANPVPRILVHRP